MNHVRNVLDMAASHQSAAAEARKQLTHVCGPVLFIAESDETIRIDTSPTWMADNKRLFNVEALHKLADWIDRFFPRAKGGGS